MYEQYYTSSDMTIMVSSLDNKKQVLLDTATGIGFSHNINAIPIYGLGSNLPQTFSMGNSLVSGTLELSFKSTQYLQKSLNYVLNVPVQSQKLRDIEHKAEKGLQLTAEEIEYYWNNRDKSTSLSIKSEGASLAEYTELVNIILRYNNSNSFQANKDQFLIIHGVRFLSVSQGVSSSAEGLITDQIRFVAKTLQHSQKS